MKTLKYKYLLIFILNLFFSKFALANFDSALTQAKALNFDSSVSYSEGQVLDFQESVVDEMYKKLMEDSSYNFDLESEDFKQYIRAIGFFSMHSAHHNAGSYIAEILEKLNAADSVVWKKIKSILPSSVFNKLKADYDIEVRAPRA